MSNRKANPFPGGLLVLSPQGKLIEAPLFFMKALDLSDDAMPSIYELFDDTSLPYLSFDRVLRRQNGVFEFYVHVIDGQGRPKGFRYWSVSPNQSTRRHTPITFYLVDESSLLQNQEWALRKQRREILNHVRLSLRQYIRTKVSGVQALAETLMDNPDLAVPTSTRMLDAVGDLLGSLDDIIEVSDIPWQDDPQVVSLKEATETINTWGTRDTQIVAVHHDDKEAFLQVEVLERIVLPLVDNALDANTSSRPVEVNIWALGNGYARVDIQDWGLGMSEYIQEHAQDPFFTTKAGHLGLGLPQAQEAMSSIGAQWKIKSAKGDGTKITLLLPVEE